MNHDLLELADTSNQHGEKSGLGAEEGACLKVAALGGEIVGRDRPSSRVKYGCGVIPEVRVACTSFPRAERRLHLSPSCATHFLPQDTAYHSFMERVIRVRR